MPAMIIVVISTTIATTAMTVFSFAHKIVAAVPPLPVDLAISVIVITGSARAGRVVVVEPESGHDDDYSLAQNIQEGGIVWSIYYVQW